LRNDVELISGNGNGILDVSLLATARWSASTVVITAINLSTSAQNVDSLNPIHELGIGGHSDNNERKRERERERERGNR